MKNYMPQKGIMIGIAKIMEEVMKPIPKGFLGFLAFVLFVITVLGIVTNYLNCKNSEVFYVVVGVAIMFSLIAFKYDAQLIRLQYSEQRLEKYKNKRVDEVFEEQIKEKPRRKPKIASTNVS